MNEQPNSPKQNLEPRRDQTYFEKLLSYVPSDIFAAYMTFSGIIADEPNSQLLHWICFIALTCLTPLYCIYRPSNPPPMLLAANKTVFCAIASTLSFVACCFALGGPFAASFVWYRPVYGSLVLILAALLLPILETILLKQDPPSSNS